MSFLKISFLFLITALSLQSSLAIDTVATGFKIAPDEIKTIVAHGSCKKVWNTSTETHFAATATTMEWTNFIANHPSDLQTRDCRVSCSNILKMGVTTSGIYSIDIDGAGPLSAMNLYCDMDNDGGGWTRVFQHDIAGGYFSSTSAAKSSNITDPNHNLYSILDKIENFESLYGYTFRYEALSQGKNIWFQKSNPIYDGPVIDYRGIDIESSNDYWAGLEYGNRQASGFTNGGASLADGSVEHTNWWYAVGSTVAHSSGIPGMSGISENGALKVTLSIHDSGLMPMSCQHIVELGEHKASGMYTIYPDQKTSLDVYCDMDTLSGGWTLFYANSANAGMTVKKSWHQHAQEKSGISVTSGTYSNFDISGMIDYSQFSSANEIMAKDIGNWTASEFAAVSLSNTHNFSNFVSSTLISSDSSCRSLPFAGNFRYQTSNGDDYEYDTFLTFGTNEGYGWGDCMAAGHDQTTTSDVQVRPRHFTYRTAGAADTTRVRGVAGFNAGDANVVARYFLRESSPQPQSCMDILISGKSKGDGTYTIYPRGVSTSVVCDMTTNGGGWTKVWHGYPNEAYGNITTNQVYSKSNKIPFNQMMMKGENTGEIITDSTYETAYLNDTVVDYYQDVVSDLDANKPTALFHDFDGNQDVQLVGGYFFRGYGNEWRYFNTCINVRSTSNLYIGGGYKPVCKSIDSFVSSSISTCTGSGDVYCSDAMNSVEVDSGLGLTLKQYQETSVWVRGLKTYRSCREIIDSGFSHGDGIYLIDGDAHGPEDPFKTYCDMTTDGGGWTLVWSNTRDGTNKPVSNLSYSDAINTRPRCSTANSAGPLDISGDCATLSESNGSPSIKETVNYYLGLKHWDNIAQDGDFELLHQWSWNYGEAVSHASRSLVRNFDAGDNYKLVLTNYKNLLGAIDSGLYSSHNGQEFTAVDTDNDNHASNCSSLYDGSPFWYDACWSGSMNGGGENIPNGHTNGSYWTSSASSFATSANGQGGGNGWYFIRERKSSLYPSSCKEILENNPDSQTGVYNIELTAGSRQSRQDVYCDMTTDGGGWTLVAYSNGSATASVENGFMVSTLRPSYAAEHDKTNYSSSLNPEYFSKLNNTTDAMFISPSFNSGSAYIENGFGTWDYDNVKCTGALRHTSRTAGCPGQSANDSFSSADAFNIAINSGNEGIVPAYKATEVCFNGKGSCTFHFFLR